MKKLVILGIDPGLATIGFCALDKDERGAVKVLDYGVILTPKEEKLPTRLLMLERSLKKIIDKYQPEEVALEELFFNNNQKTAINVAQARGVTLLTCVKNCKRLYEYTPLQIKQAITGYGRADKKQIQEMVKRLLHLNKIPRPDDAADACAVALTHIFTNRISGAFGIR